MTLCGAIWRRSRELIIMRRLPLGLLALVLAGCASTTPVKTVYPSYPPYPAYPLSPAYPTQDDKAGVTSTGLTVPTGQGKKPNHLGSAAGVDTFTYLSGTSGTVTVPAGTYVTGVGAYATTAGTLVITPNGQGVTAPVAGPSIPIPAGVGWSMLVPVLIRAPQELGAGTIFVFTGTTSYTITLESQW